MKTLCLIAASALCVTVAPSACAKAEPGLDRDYGFWTPISLKVPIYKKWQATLQVQPRFQDAPEHNFTELIIRAGAGYKFNDRWSLFAGYYWSSHANPAFNLEHRLFQQADYAHKIGRCSIQHRFRLEETQRESYVGASIRMRHQISLNYPIGGPKSRWYLALSEEPIINLNEPDNGPERGLSQNRIFVGLGKKLRETIRVEGGYMNQFRNNSGKTPDLVNHALVVQVSIDLTRLKKKAKTQVASKPGP